jgi:hypothetical protein
MTRTAIAPQTAPSMHVRISYDGVNGVSDGDVVVGTYRFVTR